MGIAYYLSHPQVQVDPARAVPDWSLSDVGRARLCLLGDRRWLASVRRIVSSDERKAIETATILSEAIGQPFEIGAAMHENDRSATGYLPAREFEATADRFFATPEVSVRGWERAVDAQRRIVDAVRATFGSGDDGQTVVFVGHGGVGTLLKCAIRNQPIARCFDQAAEGGDAGGGNVHAFEADFSRSCFGWTRMEDVD
ncbi:histidine phosphatase family protein [Sphingomonas sp. HMWF008]|nr:histidine phosphatase family protein [Sphingomonas sp. HMWF008]